MATAADHVNNTATCSLQIIVRDAQAPTITCPANVQVNAPSTGPSLTVSWTEPVTSDNQGVKSVASSPVRGASFTIGVTTVRYTVTDLADLTAQCTFTVTVKDVTDPTITCPSSLTVNTKPGQNKGQWPFLIAALSRLTCP